MEENEYVKWYKLARATVGNSKLIPERTDLDIIENQISRENWLNLSPAKNLENVSSSINPNIWFSIDGGRGYIGLHFNSKDSMKKIRNIMSSAGNEQKIELINLMKDLEDTWETALSRKIKTSHPRQSPDYYNGWKIPANKLDDETIEELFKKSRKIYYDGERKAEVKKGIDKYYSETPVLNLVKCDFSLNENEFKKQILIAHKILEICYEVKTDAQTNKELQKVLEKKKKQITNLRKLNKLDSKIIPKEISDKRMANISKLENEILELEKELS